MKHWVGSASLRGCPPPPALEGQRSSSTWWSLMMRRRAAAYGQRGISGNPPWVMPGTRNDCTSCAVVSGSWRHPWRMPEIPVHRYVQLSAGPNLRQPCIVEVDGRCSPAVGVVVEFVRARFAPALPAGEVAVLLRYLRDVGQHAVLISDIALPRWLGCGNLIGLQARASPRGLYAPLPKTLDGLLPAERRGTCIHPGLGCVYELDGFLSNRCPEGSRGRFRYSRTRVLPYSGH